MARKQSTPRLEFETAVIHEYFEHSRPWPEVLPKLPGVYQPHGDSNIMPPYVGKSINLCSRVLSHLRTPEGAAMLRQSQRITWQHTAGELEALLLEMRLIKEQWPLFNKRLRRNRQLYTWRLAGRRLQVVYIHEVDFSHQQHLYGLFANRRVAPQILQSLVGEQHLCYGLPGLGSLSRGRACFRSVPDRCTGACYGKESVEAHSEHLLAQTSKLQPVCWPWVRPVVLEKRNPSMTQYHVIHNWLWLGAVDSLDQTAELARLPAGFDQGDCKILCKPLFSGHYPLHLLG